MPEQRRYYKDMARVLLARVCKVENLDQQQRLINHFVRKGDKHYFGFLWAVADESLDAPIEHIKDWVHGATEAIRTADTNRLERRETIAKRALNWFNEMKERDYDVSASRWDEFRAWLNENPMHEEIYAQIDTNWGATGSDLARHRKNG